MGSTGKSDRKRRHFSSISPTSAAAKTSPFSPASEDKKLDAAVLQYQNQKLVQQLEAQKVEFFALESKFHHLKDKQKAYDDTLKVVNRSWEKLVDDLESMPIETQGSANGGCNVKHSQISEDFPSCPLDATFLCRLLETGATESCSWSGSDSNMENDSGMSRASTKNILQSILSAINDLDCTSDGLSTRLLEASPEDESIRQIQQATKDLEMQVKNLRMATSDLHMKHRSLGNELQTRRDTNAKNKAQIRHLAGELESTIAELEESNSKLATLKAQKDTPQGAYFHALNFGNRYGAGHKAMDKQKDLHDMESALKDLLNLSSSQLQELQSAHEERIEILKKLSNFRNILKDVKHISSSKTYLLVRDQVENSKAEIAQYQALLEKLQAEKDNFVWWEKEALMKIDLADISRKATVVGNNRIIELEKELQRQFDERIRIETRLQEASGEPGRKEIIAEFKALLSSLPKDIGIMQSQLYKYKEAASEVHSLRAEVRYLSNILNRKANELEDVAGKSAEHGAEIQKLKAVVYDLKESEKELKLFLEMYRRESTDSRDVIEARDLEYKAWAHVQNLQSSLDEHKLESRVKAANEAEAISQQKLAAAEAEIADLRQKLEASGRDISELSEILKSKHEEGESYLSEIETIGQAYEDMQSQNQHLLQQITESDDYNIKVVIDGVKARQVQEALCTQKQAMEREMLQAHTLLDFYSCKAARIEELLKICSEQVGKLSEEGWKNSVVLETTKTRLLDVQRETQQLRQSLEGSQSKVEKSRLDVSALQIELENERFNKRRTEEELDVLTRKASQLSMQAEGSTVLEKLQQEIIEYREILKCGVCHDRQKEVVIAKCYHLFCGPCVQRTLESRHRKCPMCSASFGPNDVKNVYI